MSNCPPHYFGPSCEWPICVNGRVDSISRTCHCRHYFAPPFCETCLTGFWGALCDRQYVPGTEEPSLSPYIQHVCIYLAILIMIIAIYITYHNCCRSRQRSLPPSYEEISKDQPPPYSA